ncbi:ROK family transcriptional regulator [Streptomyces chitinivorans]|uniref:ROK family transcriptional regulator n=1 Tax=Streptomyces chitinivorans TaxID=1257027 RepID=A0ABW7I126_9ACTN|nr:ROK family transcriptional regulator [Streptomyces chitinivorans]MDH2407667.1 ROK family transcriptional regulator [Streptomyces chitinivorans]
MTGTTPGTPRVLRAMNDRAALELLLAHGSLSRGRIGRLTGLSKPTASQLLARLEAAGLVRVTGASEGRPGPNARLYSLDPAAAHVAGLDVTATRIRAAVADVTGRTVGSFEVPAPGRSGPCGACEAPGPSGAPEERSTEPVVRQVVAAVDGAAEAAGLTRSALHRVVIGTPGAFDPRTGRLRYASHLPGWHSPGLLEELAAALPVPVEYDNDVNLAAVAEHRLGAARGHEDFVLLWNEQGLGAALVLGGRLHRGRTGGAGEVGFLPVPGAPLLRRVARANRGGFQELAGARALLRTARELGIEPPAGRDGEAAAKLLARAVERAGPEAGQDGGGPYGELLRRAATGLATGLAALVAVLDPELIVLSGGVLAAGGEVLRELVRRELDELAVPRPRLVLGTVTDHPVLSGALESALATTRDEVFDTSR